MNFRASGGVLLEIKRAIFWSLYTAIAIFVVFIVL